MNLGSPVNSASADFSDCISPDGCSLYFSGGLGVWSNNVFIGGDTYVATRPTKDSPWGPPVSLVVLPSRNGSTSSSPRISADGLALFFGSDYADVSGWMDIWLATRTSSESKWGTPILLGPEINTLTSEQDPSISADGSTLYWASGTGGASTTWDLWQSTIYPIIDFNGDGFVEIGDLVTLIENWGTAEPLCDVGPMPWGDGIVDEADLEVLMRYWGQEPYDPTLIAHWKLDEAAGITAADGVGDNNATVMGAAWQPEGGKIGGALAFDGKDDFAMSAKPVLDPAKGPFSALAWIKGGAPGQTILSQMGAVNWLTTNAQGALMTELSKGGRSGGGLSSQAIITDGNWHRVGFTWDGAKRRLYVDSVLAAEDTQDKLADSYGKLILGSTKNMAPGTFWSGLIDDVRIYSRIVRP
jgi:hypothetical protein